MKRILFLLTFSVFGILSRVAAQSITAAEYFVNTDPGVGNATPIPVPVPGDTLSGSFTLNVTGLTPGFHNLYVRGRDAAGQWGFTHRQTIYVAPLPAPSPPIAEQVVAAEFFINTDPGVGNGTPIAIPTPGDTVNAQNLPITVTQCLSPGTYPLYIRGRNAAGQWGFYASTTITIQSADAGIVSLVHQPASNCSITDSESFQITVANTGQNVLPAGIIRINLGVTGANTGNYGPFVNAAPIPVGGQAVITATGVNLASPGLNTITASFVLCNDGPAGNSASIQVTGVANPLPTVNSVSNQSVCVGASTTTIVFSGNTPGATYSWTNNNTAIGLAANGTGNIAAFTATNPGNTPITATITVTPSSNGCNGAPRNFTITVNPLPTAAISGDLDFCQGQSSTLTASGGSSYLWSTGANTNSISVNTAGAYSVTATDANGCTDDASVNVTVFNLPTAVITGDLSLCPGQVSVLTAGGAASYAWSTGAITASINISSAGTYSVTATDANGCTDDASATATQNPAVNAGITGDTDFCQGQSSTLTATGGLSYVWSTGANTASISVNTAGSYTVTATDANGCTGAASVNVIVYNLPSAGISGDLSICTGESTTLTASGGVSYLWSNGASMAQVTVGGGSYSVTATDANGCTNTAGATVVVNALPNIAISGSLDFCTGESTTLTATGGVSYIWSTGSTNNSIVVSTPGSYSVTGTDANSCANSTTVNVSETANVNVVISGDLSLCAGESATLTATAGASYSWSTGANTQSIQVNTAGTYAVTVTSASGCTGTNLVQVVVNPLPTASISGDLSICAAESTLLSASGGVAYVWSTGAATQTITVTTGGSYAVTVTDANGCSKSTSVSVFQSPAVLLTPVAANVTCNGSSTGSVTLSATGGKAPLQFTWNTGASSQNLMNVPAGNYSVTATDAAGCTAGAAATVSQPVPIVLNTSTTPVDCNQGANGSVTLTVVSGGVSPLTYSWSNGAQTKDLPALPVGSYTVTVTDAGGCTAVTSATVTIDLNNVQPLKITCPASVPVLIPNTSCRALLADYAAQAVITGGCAGTLNPVVQIPAPGGVVNPGVVLVQLSVSNNIGESSSCAVQVRIAGGCSGN